MPKMIRVAVFAPGADVAFVDMLNDLPTMQELVGGYIEMVPLDCRGTLIGICNEDGKRLGLTPTRIIVGPAGADWIVGTFFVCRRRDPALASLKQSDERGLQEWNATRAWDISAGAVCDWENFR